MIERRRWPATLAQPAALAPLAALVAGAVLALAFAPFNLWFLGLLSPAALIWLWQDASPRRAAWLGFAFNFGTFAAGTYWLYISVHGFGLAPIWLALLLMLALVCIMSSYQALLGWVVARWLPRRGALRWMIGVPAAWLLVEWLRGWLFSGFSWLSLGLSQTDTWLRGFAPVIGMHGISLLLLTGAGALVTLLRGERRERLLALAVLVLPWPAGALLDRIEWTRVTGAPVAVAVVQGAIPQDEKWLESNRDTTLRIYRDLTRSVLGTPLIVWPEAAAPDLANNLLGYIGGLYKEASARGSSLVMGVLRADPAPDGKAGEEIYFNAIVSLSQQVGWYDKRHLVPFSEFFPVPSFVRRWLRLMSLPYSDFTHGAEHQPPLRAAGLVLGATICYEDAYGSAQLDVLDQATALVNVTNDAWFGHSTARYQHLQLSRMRALEARRWLIRAANDGISAVVGPRGEVVATAPEYQATVLRSAVVPRLGLPPYARTGNWLVVLLACGMLLLAVLTAARRAGAGQPHWRT